MSLRDVPLKTEYRSLLNNVIETFYTQFFLNQYYTNVRLDSFHPLP